MSGGQGNWQIPLSAKSKEKTSFSTSYCSACLEPPPTYSTDFLKRKFSVKENYTKMQKICLITHLYNS